MARKKQEKPPQPGVLVQDIDYYLENGHWVFTAQYLRKRGQCCGSGCRHCPYGFKLKEKKST